MILSTPPKPLLAFKIYPEGRQFYFRVHIFKTPYRMNQWYRATKGEEWTVSRGTQVLGICSFATSGNGRCMGDIMLNQHYLDAATIAHECVHAAIKWHLVKHPTSDILDDPEAEERFCIGVDRMITQIHRAVLKHGLRICQPISARMRKS